MKIAVVGLGLIGGSIAKAFRAKTDCIIYGMNRSEQVVHKAKLVGAIDQPLTDALLGECDAVFIALYPQKAVEWLTDHAALIKKGALVLDACGVKQPVCEPCYALAQAYGFDFIGGHPMAGVAQSGFDVSSAELFVGASMVLVPPTNMAIETVARAKALVLQLGFGAIKIVDAAEHDQMIAYTSQLCHVISSAYVQSPCALRQQGFSAGSYRDMTRIAGLKEEMWTELCIDNQKPLVAELDAMIKRLEGFKDALERQDSDALRSLFQKGRLQKEKSNEAAAG